MTGETWQILDWDPLTGRTVRGYEEEGILYVRTEYPVEELAERNAFFRAEGEHCRFGEGKRVASIPLNLFHDQLFDACRNGDQKFLSRWLNDGDHQMFRTFRGKV